MEKSKIERILENLSIIDKEYSLLKNKFAALEQSCNEKNGVITELNNTITALKTNGNTLALRLRQLSRSVSVHPEFSNESEWGDYVSGAEKALAEWEGENEVSKPSNDIALYETRLAIRMLLKVFKSVEKSPEQEKYYSQADYIFKKHHNVTNVLRNNQKEDQQ
jgi:uncharacterized coiled-coil protein SlyX